jgi:hypothetical protein
MTSNSEVFDQCYQAISCARRIGTFMMTRKNWEKDYGILVALHGWCEELLLGEIGRVSNVS